MRIFKIGLFIVGLALCASKVQAQKTFSTQAINLDDGLGHIITLAIPVPSASGTFTFPSGGGSAPPNGAANGQMLRWNTGIPGWEIATATNVGNNMSVPGTITSTFSGNGAAVTNVNALTLNGQTNANLHDASLLTGTYAALSGAAITNVNALTLNGQTNANLHDASLLTGTYAGLSGAAITSVNALTLNGQTNANLHDASLLTGTYAGLSGASITNVNALTLNGQTNANLHDAGLLTGTAAAINGSAITNLAGANVTGTVPNATAATTASGLTAAGWASPGAIGSTTPSTGAFTTITGAVHADASGAYTVAAGDFFVLENHAAATVTLPATATVGRIIVVKDANASDLTVSGNGHTIDGSASVLIHGFTFPSNNSSVMVIGDGTNWWVIGTSYGN